MQQDSRDRQILHGAGEPAARRTRRRPQPLERGRRDAGSEPEARSTPKTSGSASGKRSVALRQASVPAVAVAAAARRARAAKSSRRPSSPDLRPSNSKTPCCTTSSPTRTVSPPLPAGRDRPGGRFQLPSGNCTSEIFGCSARTRPNRSSPPVTERPPPIVSSSAVSSGSPRQRAGRCRPRRRPGAPTAGRLEVDPPEVDGPLQELGQALLRDALEERLEAVGVPDRVARRAPETAGRSEEPRRRQALRLVRASSLPRSLASSRHPRRTQTPQESFPAS